MFKTRAPSSPTQARLASVQKRLESGQTPVPASPTDGEVLDRHGEMLASRELATA